MVMMDFSRQYQSLTELRDRGTPSDETKSRFRKMDLAAAVKRLEMVYQTALLQTTVLEEQYILFYKAINLCEVVKRREDIQFDGVANIRTTEILRDSIEALERLTRELKQRPQVHVREVQPVIVERKPTFEDEIAQEEFGNYITPFQLVRFVEECRKVVLVIDFRRDHFPNIEYEDHNLIKVLPLDSELIVQGLIFSHLFHHLRLQHRHTLNSISNYGLVVLMGDELSDPECTPFSPNSKCKLLLDALTVYNTVAKLRMRPLLLQGGFQAWERCYPVYVERSGRRDHYHDFGSMDDFMAQVESARKQLIRKVEYPRLVDYPMTPDMQNRSPVVRNVPIRIEGPRAPLQPPAYNNIHGNHSDLSPVSRPKGYQADQRSSNYGFDKKIPEQGGARVDTSCIQPHQSISAQRPGQFRPPTPDRSTKQKIQDPVLLENLKKIADWAYETIDTNTPESNVPPGCTGLQNMGNTCFMNATLQALFNTPKLQKFFSRSKFLDHINGTGSENKGIMTAVFSALMDHIWSGRFAFIRPECFFQCFARVCPTLTDRQQHDAQEFLTLLLGAIHEDTNMVPHEKQIDQNYNGVDIPKSWRDYEKKAKQNSNSPIRDIFYMVTASQLQCTQCFTSSLKFEELNQIMLELPSGSECHINGCLEEHFKDTFLEGNNPWNCPTCNQPRRAKRSSKLWSLPPVIIINLKRFAMNQEGRFEKKAIDVNFDLNTLDLSQFLHPDAQKQNAEYRLYAVTNHDGTLDSGHYTAFIHNRPLNTWLKFDDEHCKEAEISEIQTNKAYILYYTNC
ncbi:unnamed protein product [Bursaphelenchus xylophilus]|uniref:Ubiquitin carboxyl-terminal hydrolase n=1 Tax=Bursaphelenchus xylophilus TaxID=6326 RepID=A0A1I7RT62_BURXY|nr:unnamed protein product [Bursaphelenchus xylophilus]CAG9122586.1 unnamed protein product [Bursaphelenchus xylophilus]